jgi:hypothetical protein
MARIKLYGPDGSELELYRGIGFLNSLKVQRPEEEHTADCIGHVIIEGTEEDWAEQCADSALTDRCRPSTAARIVKSK